MPRGRKKSPDNELKDRLVQEFITADRKTNPGTTRIANVVPQAAEKYLEDAGYETLHDSLYKDLATRYRQQVEDEIALTSDGQQVSRSANVVMTNEVGAKENVYLDYTQDDKWTPELREQHSTDLINRGEQQLVKEGVVFTHHYARQYPKEAAQYDKTLRTPRLKEIFKQLPLWKK